MVSHLHTTSLGLFDLTLQKAFAFAEHRCCCQSGLSLHPTATSARRGPGLIGQVRGPSGGEEVGFAPREPRRSGGQVCSAGLAAGTPSAEPGSAARAGPPADRSQRRPASRPAALRSRLLGKPRPLSPAPAGFAAAPGSASPTRSHPPAGGGRGAGGREPEPETEGGRRGERGGGRKGAGRGRSARRGGRAPPGRGAGRGRGPAFPLPRRGNSAEPP